ncbi:MAG: class I SAM-dependent methyltransferase [Acidobacteria bacterium]|nr:class I SAM-dependent methyltransferase [Acidobacteriota bacterium]
MAEATEYELVACRSCAARYLSPLPSVEALQKLYSSQYYGSDWYKQQGWGMAFAKSVLRDKRPGRFLDVGCGLGYFIDGVRKHSDWDVYGVEFGADAVDYAKDKLGLNVYQGELADVQFPDDFFDYIQIRNVLEHVTSPMTLLRECRRILKADGVFHLFVPNGRVDSLGLIDFYRSVGKAAFSRSGHLFFFPQETLRWMFEEVGLEIVRSRTYGIRRGLASLGYWPRFKDWKRDYFPRVNDELPDDAQIRLPPRKKRPDLYYTYRLLRMNMRMLPGMRDFGLDYELLLKVRR